MATDFTLSVLLTRSLLGLSDLEVNDHDAYYVAAGSGDQLSPVVQWEKDQATSRYVEGAVTVSRVRKQFNLNLTVEVMGDTQSDITANIAALLQAATQDHYTLKITVNSVPTYYAAEAADYGAPRTGPRINARQVQIALQVPVQPVPSLGVV